MAKLAVVLISGGMDSAYAAASAKNDGFEIAALHFNYGQKTQSKELQAFNALCGHFAAKKELSVDIGYFKQIGGSSLTDDKMTVRDGDLENNSVPDTYVPFRNANMLAIATSWAEVIGAEAIYIGAMEEDSSGYPDTRKIFFDNFQGAVNTGTKPETNIKIYIPAINFKKSDIVREGTRLGVPFEKTWSCYRDTEKACGKCDSCLYRLRGFDEAGVKDPLEYENQ